MLLYNVVNMGISNPFIVMIHSHIALLAVQPIGEN